MLGRKTIAPVAALAVAGVLVLGGCGGGDSATGSTAPAKSSDGAAMHGDDAMKPPHEDAMKGDHGAGHGDDAMHGKTDDHSEAMKGN
jgi:hypothetical protein